MREKERKGKSKEGAHTQTANRRSASPSFDYLPLFSKQELKDERGEEKLENGDLESDFGRVNRADSDEAIGLIRFAKELLLCEQLKTT